MQLDRGGDNTVLGIVVASQTTVDVTLRRPLVVAPFSGPETVTALRLHADDAQGLVTALRARLRARDVAA